MMKFLTLLVLAIPAVLSHPTARSDDTFYSIAAHATVCWEEPSGLILGGDYGAPNITCANAASTDPLFYSLGYASTGCSFTLYEEFDCPGYSQIAFIPAPSTPEWNGCDNLPLTGPGFRSLSVSCTA
ncbi:hypothetical protein PHLCEN_2v10908 [Hermanssonia centrifuga]|uniref:Uncharacterized protein n=1 Tax=Hermanssonia centrifuga TaxID=98765 RepID=A0A2R6NLP8_9APHY|nr:hypothetical protein PHLCEN_2v10908 [Hermanssonia centrifuga]